MDSTFAARSAAIRSKHLLDEHGAGTVLVQLVRTWRPRMTRPASKTQDGTVTVLKIGEARDKLPQMVSSLESGSSATYVVLSLIHISEPTRLGMISYAVFC